MDAHRNGHIPDLRDVAPPLPLDDRLNDRSPPQLNSGDSAISFRLQSRHS
jgi:hypothetical protein